MSLNKHERGWDHFTPENAETFDIKNCRVCGRSLTVTKGQHGPTGFVEAMGGRGHDHDVVSCDSAGESWHDQALDILKESEKTASRTLRFVLESEASAIVGKRVPTIEGYSKRF